MQVKALSNRIEWKTALFTIVGLFLYGFLPIAFAGESGTFQGACERVEGFMGNVVTILGAVSVSVVTIAIMFAGYQIAFAHKRLTEVTPILVGGLLIGGAGTIAIWFVDGMAATC